jgi:hypothetical protein
MVNCTVAYTVTKFQNLAHCNGSGQTVAMQMSQSDNFLVVRMGGKFDDLSIIIIIIIRFDFLIFKL